MTAFVILLVTGLIVIAATWSDLRQVHHGIQHLRHHGVGASGRSPVTSPPTTYEGLLVRQLLTGSITAAQYRRAMSAAAARDAGAHPVHVPPDGPDDPHAPGTPDQGPI